MSRKEGWKKHLEQIRREVKMKVICKKEARGRIQAKTSRKEPGGKRQEPGRN